MTLIERRQKVIFIDWMLFVFRAIFFCKDKNMHPPYLCVTSLIACLNRLEITPDDLIILAVDGPNNWRKEIDSNYKSNRKAQRDKTDIDWTQQFGDFNALLYNLNISTPFHIVKVDKLEADDIIAYGVRYYKDCDVVIISSDSDYDQLMSFDNVKIFSPVTKKYKIVKNAYKTLAKKIKIERTDNLISPILNEADYKKREMLVSLLSLPEAIETLAYQALVKVISKSNNEYNSNNLLFRKLKDRLDSIFANDVRKVEVSDSFKKKRSNKKVEQTELSI